MLKVAYMIYLLAAFLVIFDAQTPESYSWLTIIIATSLALFGRGIEKDYHEGEKNKRDKNAWIVRQKVVGALLSDMQLPRYFVYLRPFSIDGSLPSSPSALFDSVISPTHYALRRDLESYLAEALQPAGALIRLGGQGSDFGAGKLLSEPSRWRKDIIKLIDCAALIFIIPGHHDGTAWEIDHLRNNDLWHKTIFIAPPCWQIKKKWKQTKHMLESKGVFVPRFNSSGRLYMLNRDFGSITRQVSLGARFSSRRFRRKIERLLPQNFRAYQSEFSHSEREVFGPQNIEYDSDNDARFRRKVSWLSDIAP